MTRLDRPVSRALLPILTPLSERFDRAGHRLHLVGGVVRDLLLDRDPSDLDFTTDARPPAIKAALDGWAHDLWTQGERFGTIGARRDGTTVEITTYRAESYDPGSRKPEVRFGDSLLGDLERRDFTINSMAVDLPSFELVDPHSGEADLRAGLLRTPLSPTIAFDDDPLRMLRAARFTTRFGLTVDPDLMAAMSDRAGRIAIVSAERIHDELYRLLAAADPRPGLRLLADTGLLNEVLPEAGDVDERVVDADSVLARLAVLVHRHGADAARARMTALKASLDDRRAVATAVDVCHDIAGLVDCAITQRPAEVRRLHLRAGTHLDVVRSVGATLAPEGTAIFDAVVEELQQTEDLDDLGPGLSGHDVANTLGVEPGPVIGRAQAFLTELRLDEGELPAKELRRRLLAWRDEV